MYGIWILAVEKEPNGRLIKGMSYLEKYTEYLKTEGRDYLVDAICDTASTVLTTHVMPEFNWGETNKTGLLFGHIQSGKTSHVFGIIARAADEGFNIFLLLTTDNNYLQAQTFERTVGALSDFNVCNESDETRFLTLARRKPTILVLKKNARILNSWRKRLAASNLFPGNPIFIIDDEADSASLNTKVNQNDISTINLNLRKIKQLSKSGVYLQITATPQSLFLQTKFSQWKPEFVEVFKPGDGYIGGNFFFSEDHVPNSISITDDLELTDLLHDDEFAANGLMRALITFLLTSAHLTSTDNAEVCNFIIHPSQKITHHEHIAEKIGEYLNHIIQLYDELANASLFKDVYDNLCYTNPNLLPYNDAISLMKSLLESESIAIKVMNSHSKMQEYDKGLNIIVGGNSLGRGITFPMLQTIYYCRASRIPQADTVWQHCRMFGYDRDPNLVRAFMPPRIYRALTEMNGVNNSLFTQASRNNIEDLKIYYSRDVKPTRNNVLDSSKLSIIAGGVNYFPFDPVNTDIVQLDHLLADYGEKIYDEVNSKFIIELLKLIDNDDMNEWSNRILINCINAYSLNHGSKQAILIIRRDRDITKGTGTLLSPDDRSLGQRFEDQIVLTLYKVTGTKGWNGQQLWIPNIKFPNDTNFYDISD